MVSGLTATLVTGTCAASTVTAQAAVLVLFLLLVAVIVAVPALTGVTTPFLLTDATDGLLELQVTFWLTLGGLTVAVKVMLAPPAVIFRVSGATITPVTWAAYAAGAEMSRIARAPKNNKVFFKKCHDICFLPTKTPPHFVCNTLNEILLAKSFSNDDATAAVVAFNCQD
jgi:hypothetical protein